jgi:hypothetical protein
MHTRMTSYRIDNKLEDEVGYVGSFLREYDKLCARGYDCRIPPALTEDTNKGKNEVSETEIRGAIAADLEVGSSIEELIREWESQERPIFEAFFARMKRHPPMYIKVHLTKYGPGGSYYPNGFPGRQSAGWAISIKDPRIAKFRWSFNQTIVHETIELLIHDEICRRQTPSRTKEAIVDQFGSCRELQSVYGTYPKQGGSVAGPLPEDWESYIVWRPQSAPSWD